MNLSSWSIKNPIPAVMLFVLLTLAGLLSFKAMKVQNFPDLELPTVSVSASLPGAAPAQLETEVARKLENAIAPLQGLKNIYTNVSDGLVTVTAEFRLEKTTQEAVDDVRSAVQGVRSELPSDVRGVTGYQCYATADLGLIAYETMAREGLVLDEGVIVEIVRPGTGEPLPEGEVGEVVVTTLNATYPLVRFGTGDLSAILPGQCPTGRTNQCIQGWMGRADQTTKVRGMFVHPKQVDDVVKRFPELGRVRLVVSGEMANDAMTLQAETSAAPEGLLERLADAMREVTKLRTHIQLVALGSLPNDGKVIEDARSYR